jgi:dipeptide transport system ATP-binding protein
MTKALTEIIERAHTRAASPVGVMQAGKLVEEGSAEQILTHSQHPYTQALLKSVSRVDSL